MGTVAKQANFLLPQDLLEELKKAVSKRQQSKLVARRCGMSLKGLSFKKRLKEVLARGTIRCTLSLNEAHKCLSESFGNPPL